MTEEEVIHQEIRNCHDLDQRLHMHRLARLKDIAKDCGICNNKLNKGALVFEMVCHYRHIVIDPMLPLEAYRCVAEAVLAGQRSMGDMRKSRRQGSNAQHQDQLPQPLQQQQESGCEQSEGVDKGMEFGEDAGMDEEVVGRSAAAVQ